MKPLVQNNLMYFPIESQNTFGQTATQKYVAGTRNGLIFMSEIYTLAEIKEQYPDIKEVDEPFVTNNISLFPNEEYIINASIVFKL